MDEYVYSNAEENQPVPEYPASAAEELPTAPFFPTGKRECVFGVFLLILGCLLCNSMFFAGLNLGFALFAGCIILCSTVYLLVCGHKFTVYSGILLALSLVLCAAFARSDDAFVKFIQFCFLLASTNLGLCLLAGQNRRDPKGVTSLLDIPRTAFMLGLGKLPETFRGVVWGVRNSGTAGKKGSAVLLGLVIAIPLLCIVIPLLISADAAFDALLQQLPDWDVPEIFVSLLTGVALAVFLYARGAALQHAPKDVPAAQQRKGLSPLTVNTVLIAIALVYVVYLISQLAYFSGGFSGILPKGYTMAEYARRGFFEMAWLCAINLAILALAVGLVAKETAAPLLTRLICLFIGLVTLFLVTSASAKMFLYIDAYGLTRLRVLTQVIIFFLGITTVLVCIWLFAPKLPYMKAVLLIALVMGTAVAWADVDTVVARYNVNAYQSGKLETIDVDYLDSLGRGAVPYIAQLLDDPNTEVADAARNALTIYYGPGRLYAKPTLTEDFREWNYVNCIADDYLLFQLWYFKES